MDIFSQILDQLKRIATSTQKSVGLPKGNSNNPLNVLSSIIGKIPGLGWAASILHDLHNLLNVNKKGFSSLISAQGRGLRSQFPSQPAGFKIIDTGDFNFGNPNSPGRKISDPIRKTFNSIIKNLLRNSGLPAPIANSIFKGWFALNKVGINGVNFLAKGLKFLKTPLGIFLTAIVLATAGLFKLGKASFDAAKKLLEEQRKYAQYNGKLLHSYAVAELKDIVRNIDYAERTSEATIELQRAFNALKDTLMPIEATFTNLKAKLITVGVRGTNATLSGWGMITGLRDWSEVEGMGEFWYKVQDGITYALNWMQGLDARQREEFQKTIEELRKNRENSKYLNTPLERFLSDVAIRGLDAHRGRSPQKRLFQAKPAIR